MDKEKSLGFGLPPSSSNYTSFVSSSNDSNANFSHDVSRMPEHPPRSTGHRRAHSEILSLPDDLTFDSDLGIVGSGTSSRVSDETEEDVISMYIDMEKLTSMPMENEASLAGGDGGGASSSSAAAAAQDESSSGRPRPRHQHSQSMDGLSSVKPEMLNNLNMEGLSAAEAKKALSAQKLAELSLVDPRRAKRIWANRQSAARSKERKMRYIAELEKRVQALQTEATTLSAQLGMLQRDTTSLAAENSELRLHLQTMEQQTNLQNALNDALREEVQRLRVATGLAAATQFGTSQQQYNYNQAMQSMLSAHHLHQLQIQSQQSQQNQQSTEDTNRAVASHNQDEGRTESSRTPKE